MALVTLLDRRCKKREFALPAGWRQVKDGVAQRGDKWWRWGDESWQPVENDNSFLHISVSLLQCVIRRDA